MKEVYLKITIAILFVICAVLIGMTVLINSGAHLTRKHIHELEEQKEDLAQMVRKPSERFYFVTKDTSRLPDEKKEKITIDQVTFAVTEEDKILGKKLAEKTAEKTPAAVRDVFLAYLADEKEESILYTDSTQHLLKDRDTVILEEMCSHLEMEVSTKLCWDMQNQERVCISTVSMKKEPAEKAKAEAETVTFSYRRKDANPAELYCQDGIHTLVLGFNQVMLPDNADREITRPYFQIPVGGHYIHLIEVHRAENSKAQFWYLEYEVPQPEAKGSEKKTGDKHAEAESEEFHMNAISLLPGNPVISVRSGNIQTFRVPFVNGVSKLLISADRVVFPKSLIATPHNDKADAFGK